MTAQTRRNVFLFALLGLCGGGAYMLARKDNTAGDGGDIESEIRKGKAAMRELVKRAMKARKQNRNFEGEDAIIRNAMIVPNLGPVDFRWGRFKKGTGQGVGVSKVVGSMCLKLAYFGDPKFNPRLIYKVPQILARGKTRRVDGAHTRVEHGEYIVILKNTHDGKPTTNWVFTAYPWFPSESGKNLPSVQVARLLKSRKKQQKKGRE